jgi:hypothetical protein
VRLHSGNHGFKELILALEVIVESFFVMPTRPQMPSILSELTFSLSRIWVASSMMRARVSGLFGVSLFSPAAGSNQATGRLLHHQVYLTIPSIGLSSLPQLLIWETGIGLGR